MKRNNVVLNRRAVQRGRGVARWAASGMNLGLGAGREAVIARARAMLRDPALAQGFDRALSAAQAELEQKPEVVTQSTVMVALGLW